MRSFAKIDNVINHFESINRIPRGSHNERQISDFLVEFAKERGLEVHQDDLFNVIIKKAGSSGYENSPTVILQGHMDMVCEKIEQSLHDFDKDPISLLVDGDFLKADGTTLGADNGLALAYAMAILADETIAHPPLEVLFTTQEEVGLIGAGQVSSDRLNGKILINMDAEEEGVLFTSCAGGIRCLMTLPIVYEDKSDLKTYYLKISGLKGGHSGLEIDKRRANANKLLGRLLNDMDNIEVSHIEGGSKVNAITRESVATVGICDEDLQVVKDKCLSWMRIFRNEFKTSDPEINIELIDAETRFKSGFDSETRDRLLKVLKLHPYGVIGMSGDIEGLVESSVNMGVITTNDTSVTILSSARSSVESIKNEIVSQLKIISDLVGLGISTSAEYPAWEYKEDSYVRDIFTSTYEELTGQPPKITAIHAGLECGVLGKRLGDMDMISFGPTIYDVHTPQERVSLRSIENTWLYLLKVLEKIK